MATVTFILRDEVLRGSSNYGNCDTCDCDTCDCDTCDCDTCNNFDLLFILDYFFFNEGDIVTVTNNSKDQRLEDAMVTVTGFSENLGG